MTTMETYIDGHEGGGVAGVVGILDCLHEVLTGKAKPALIWGGMAYVVDDARDIVRNDL